MGVFSKIFKKDKGGDASAPPSATSTSTSPATGTTSAQAPAAASSTSANLDKPQGVILHTNLGDITIALFSEQTPKVCYFNIDINNSFLNAELYHRLARTSRLWLQRTNTTTVCLIYNSP